MDMLDAPFFVPPPEDTAQGVDFLGMRAINLTMMDRLLPGLNNVARYIRPFSLMTWVVWCYEQEVARTRRKVSRNDFERFREKIEVLFVWSHQLSKKADGVAGNQQKAPRENNVRLCFADFNRAVSLFDAVNYGPGLKTQNGLGFIFAAAPGLFKVTEAGALLAKAIDVHMKEDLSRASYAFLCSQEELRCDAGDAKEFIDAWRIDEPTVKEGEAFRSRLFQSSEIGRGSTHGHRAASLALIVRVLKARKGLATVDMVRRDLTMTSFPQQKDGLPDQALMNARQQWQVLQVRQAHRLAMEALFGWMERCLWEDRARSAAKLVELTVAAIEENPEGLDTVSLIPAALSSFRSFADSADGLFSIGFSKRKDFNLFDAMSSLSDAASEIPKDPSVPSKALRLLLQCAVFAEHFSKNADTERLANAWPVFRMPLGYLQELVTKNVDVPFKRFFEKFLETNLISQHFGVAASRFSEDKGRMRLSIEDAGLISLLPGEDKAWSPGVARDRLSTALSLLSESGLIDSVTVKGSEEEWFSAL